MKAAARVGLVVSVVTLAAGVRLIGQQNPGSHAVDVDDFRMKLAPPGQVVKPRINLLIGTWAFNEAASRMENVLAPKEAYRSYKDLGNGSYSCTQTVVDEDGNKSATQYISKDDGVETTLLRAGSDGKFAPTNTMISFKWTDPFISEQTQVDHEIITISKRELTPDGKRMVLLLPINGHYYVHIHDDDPEPDMMTWDRISDKPQQ